MKQKVGGFLFQFTHFFRGEKKNASKNLKWLLGMASKEPANANPHLRIAEIYQKMGQRQNALQESLKAAEIFCSLEQYHKAAAIYARILKENPDLDSVEVKLADTYRKMGLSEQAFTLYHKLFCFYNKTGAECQALEVLAVMAELDPQKFTLGNSNPGASESSLKGIGAHEKSGTVALDHPAETRAYPSFFDLGESLQAKEPIELGQDTSATFQENCKSEDVIAELNNSGAAELLYPNYYYQMGLVCKQMGLVNEAIKQFQIALSKGQRPIETSELLNICLREKEQLVPCKQSTEVFQEENRSSPIGRGVLTMACSPHS